MIARCSDPPLAPAYAGERTARVEPVDLGDLFEALLPALEAIPVVASRHLRFNPAPPTEPRIDADRDQLAQALTNLVVNACEAVGPEDEVELRVGGPAGASGPWVEVRNPGPPRPWPASVRPSSPPNRRA